MVVVEITGPLSSAALEGRPGGRSFNEDAWEESNQSPVRGQCASVPGVQNPDFLFEATFRITSGGRYGGGCILHAVDLGGRAPENKSLLGNVFPLVFGPVLGGRRREE